MCCELRDLTKEIKMKQITRGKLVEKIKKALDKVLPSWYDYSYILETIGDEFFVDLSVATTEKTATTQIFMDIDRFDARKAVKVEIA